MRIVKNVLPHIVIILAGIFIVFQILDSYNPTMNFVDNSISIKLFYAFCVLSILSAARQVALNRKVWKIEHSKELQE